MSLACADADPQPPVTEGGQGTVSTGPASPSAESLAVLPGLPVEVLDGTRVVPLESLPRMAIPPDPSGRYSAELGGAEVVLRIEPGPGGSWSVVRTYREPMLNPEVREYVVDLTDGVLGSEEEGLLLVGTAEGVLALEVDPGVETLPAEYWIHYVRTP
jgi:hypothetical protein